jgi:DNA repair exonuclease SbcCD ATPase subunit
MNKHRVGSVYGLNKHHERLKKEYKSNEDIDHSRTHLNYHFVEPKGSYRQQALARIEEVGARRRKDSIVMQDCLVTASPDWMKERTPEEQRAYFQYAYEFFEKHFRKENIISAVVHMDEHNPHMHLCFVPITDKGRLSSKDIIGGPAGLVEWQDRFYEHIHERFPELSRGIPVRITKRKHLPPYLFKNAANLYDHYEEIERAIQDIGMIKSKEKKTAAMELLGRYAPEMAKLKAQIPQVNDYIERLKADIDAEQHNSRYWKGEAKELEEALYQRDSKIRELSNTQQKLERLISKIPPEVLKEMEEREREARKRNRGWER